MSLNTPPSSAAGLIRAIIKPSLSYKKRHWGKHFLQAGSNLRTLLEQKDEVQYGSRAKTRKDAERALSGLRNSLRGLSINSPFETTSYLEFRSSYSDESARIDQVAEPAFDVSQHGGIVIHGRSDATLNPGGVRIGTAEIYSQVEQLHEVAESLCIGQHWDNDIRVILFVLLRDGVDLTEELQAKIKAKIRMGASPRHVPTKIVQVSDIPRTKSGKIVELAVRDVDHGRPVVNKEALANPEALDQFVAMVELSV